MKTMGRMLDAALAVCVLAGCIGLAAGWAGAEEPKASEAEAAGWKLFFSDDFDRAELGADWAVVDGAWKIVDGALRGSGTLISAKGIPADYPPGFLRMEFEAVSDVQPIIFFPNKPKPKVELGDMSSFLHAQPPESGKTPIRSGYFFQFGGVHNTVNRMTRAGTQIAVDEQMVKAIGQDQVHRIVVENDQGKLRLVVDGVKVLETDEKQSILGPGFDRVGFYFYTAAKVNWVKVYVKRLADDFDRE